MRVECCETDRGWCEYCVNRGCSVAVVRVICLDGMMSFVVDCSFAEQIITGCSAVTSQEVSRPHTL